jgi:hypothetical protein
LLALTAPAALPAPNGAMQVSNFELLLVVAVLMLAAEERAAKPFPTE